MWNITALPDRICSGISGHHTTIMYNYVTICHNIAQYVTICQHRLAHLLSDEWAVLQKEVNGVEDVPCRRVDDVEGPVSYQTWHPDSAE